MSKSTTPTASNLRTFEAMHETVFGEHDLDRLEEFFAPEAVQYEVGSEPVEGIDAIRSYFEGLTEAFSTTDLELLETVADGETVFGRFRLTATNDGPLPVTGDVVLQPTGKELSWDGFLSAAFVDGKIAEINVLTDRAGVRKQLGVQPAA